MGDLHCSCYVQVHLVACGTTQKHRLLPWHTVSPIKREPFAQSIGCSVQPFRCHLPSLNQQPAASRVTWAFPWCRHRRVTPAAAPHTRFMNSGALSSAMATRSVSNSSMNCSCCWFCHRHTRQTKTNTVAAGRSINNDTSGVPQTNPLLHTLPHLQRVVLAQATAREPPVLLKNGHERPPLQLPQAPHHHPGERFPRPARHQRGQIGLATVRRMGADVRMRERERRRRRVSKTNSHPCPPPTAPAPAS